MLLLDEEKRKPCQAAGKADFSLRKKHANGFKVGASVRLHVIVSVVLGSLGSQGTYRVDLAFLWQTPQREKMMQDCGIQDREKRLWRGTRKTLELDVVRTKEWSSLKHSGRVIFRLVLSMFC